MLPALPPLHEYYLEPSPRGRPRIVRIVDDDDGTRAEVWAHYGWTESKAALDAFWKEEDEEESDPLDALETLRLLGTLAAPPPPLRPSGSRLVWFVAAVAIAHLALVAIGLATR
jgi:hypothetical protein